MFITFEGLDASGKSTHLRLATSFFERLGKSVILTHEPGGTPLGDKIRSLFLDTEWTVVDAHVEALLLFASRKQHLSELIDPALARGSWVFCDRFTDSTYAYQSAGRGLDREWIQELDHLATGSRRPDRTFLFDLPAEVAHRRLAGSALKQRGELDRLDTENLDFYRAVRCEYLAAAEREPKRFIIIDSSGPLENTWQQVETHLSSLIAISEGGE